MREMKLLRMRSKTLVAKSQNGRILMSLSGEYFYTVKSLLRNRTKFRDWLLDAHYTQSEIGYWKHKAEGQNWTTPQVVEIAPR